MNAQNDFPLAISNDKALVVIQQTIDFLRGERTWHAESGYSTAGVDEAISALGWIIHDSTAAQE